MNDCKGPFDVFTFNVTAKVRYRVTEKGSLSETTYKVTVSGPIHIWKIHCPLGPSLQVLPKLQTANSWLKPQGPRHLKLKEATALPIDQVCRSRENLFPCQTSMVPVHFAFMRPCEWQKSHSTTFNESYWVRGEKLAERKNGLKGVRTIEALELLSNTWEERKIQSSESDFNKQTVKRNLWPSAY